MKELTDHDATSGQPIAVIGMSCRFPGARNIDEFWNNLCRGVTSVSTFDRETLRRNGVPQTLFEDPAYIPKACVIDDIDRFDAAFFGFSPQEAALLDPQQRIFLECAWEALESAGHPPGTNGARTGVYAGTRLSTYLYGLSSVPYVNAGDPRHFLELLGNDKDYLASRVSYKLNLKGPSITVQTACSTSLVAAHLACESLRRGETDMAVAGGAAILVPQRIGFLHHDGMILSPDGCCRPFDARANGTTFGNGAGVVVLKRLEDALAEGDTIWAVIKGSAVNNDGGRKAGYTAPGMEGQMAVIWEALARSQVHPETIDYLEAHGTGTPLGDPVEVEAAARVYREFTDKRQYCRLGAVKANIGHLDAAAGVASLIKTVLALRHAAIPPNPTFSAPNPAIAFSRTPFMVNTELAPWPRNGTPRRAGVSSFGIGGTNAHCILEEAPPRPAAARPAAQSDLMVLSARDAKTLAVLASRHAEALDVTGAPDLASICCTSRLGRAHFPHRLALRAHDSAELKRRLAAFAAARPASGPRRTTFRPVFLFTGQGAQYTGMGQELYEAFPEFRRHLDACARKLGPWLDVLLTDLLFAPEHGERLGQTAYTQPALFALEYALAACWMEWGVKPAAMLGHSLGEYVAACLAGVFSLDDALGLVVRRARLMHDLPASGAMTAVFAAPDDVKDLLAGLGGRLAVAVVNGPGNVVVSGPRQDLDALAAVLDGQGIGWRALAVSQAFHSPCMDPILDAFEACFADVALHAPKIPYVSNLTGAFAESGQIAAPGYWRRHLRETVRFASGLETLLDAGLTDLLEIGPHPVLSQLAGQCAGVRPIRCLASMRRGAPQRDQLLDALGEAYAAGAGIAWEAVGGLPSDAGRVPLPTYPFARTRHWAAAGLPDRRPLACADDADDLIRLTVWTQAAMPEVAAAAAGKWFLETGRPDQGRPMALLPALPGDAAAIPPDTDGILFVLADDGGVPSRDWSAPDAAALHALTRRIRHLAATAPARVRLVFATSGARARTDEAVAPGQAALWGIVQTVRQEHPGRDIRLLDIGLPQAGGMPDIPLGLLLADALPAQALLREQGLFIQRFERAALASRVPAPLRRDATYLVTGGTGGLGLALAQWLAFSGARHILLVSRNTPAAGPQAVMDALAAQGIDIRHRTCDVGDAAAVRELFAAGEPDSPPIRGVFHLASTTGDAPLEGFARTLAAKADAAGHLHANAGELELFVLFSSIAALHGSPGHAAYSAANACLDALAAHRLARGLPVTCIDWGPWDAGMTTRPGVKEALAAAGIRPLAPRRALAALARLLGSGISRAVVLDADDVAGESRPAKTAHAPAKNHAPAATSQHALLDDAKALESYLAGQIRAALKLSGDTPGRDDDLIALGLDSLMFLTLSQAISRALGVRVGPGELFAHATISRLARRVRELADRKEAAPAALPAPIRAEAGGSQAPFELTDIQYAYWIGRTDAVELGRVACHTYFELDIPDLDLKRFALAWNRLIARHAMLRCYFLAEGMQRILDAAPPYIIEAEDLRELPQNEARARLLKTRETMSHLVHQAWKWPLFEIRASLLSGKTTRVHVSFDLLIADFHSITILMRELKRFYEDDEPDLPELRFTFQDYIRHEEQARLEPSFQAARQYWADRLESLPPAPPLPLARRLSDLPAPRFSRFAASLPRERWEALKAKAAGNGLTPSCLLLAVYAEVLAVWSGSARFCINLTLFNRRDHHPQVNDIVGDFTSITLLEVDRAPQTIFLERARSLQAQFWRDMEHREYSGVRVIRDRNARGGGGPGATMPVVFTANISGGAVNQLDALMGELVHSESQTPQVWLDHQVFEQHGTLAIMWDHVADLFPQGMVQAMFHANAALLDRLAVSDDAWNETAPCRLPRTQRRVRDEANATMAPVAEATLHGLFLRQLDRHGSRLAISQGRKFFTYEGLAIRAAALADSLVRQGCGRGGMVGVSMRKGWEQVVAVLGILFAGAAFVPISPDLPAKRRHELARQADLRAVVVQEGAGDETWPEGCRRMVVTAAPSGSRPPLPEIATAPEDLAYVIFTSGSTGQPKGVMISHQSAVNTLLDVNSRFKVRETDSLLALSDLSFDLAIYDIFGALAAGAAVVMPDADGVRDPEHWRDVMFRAGTTIWNSAPALMGMLVEYAEASGRGLPPSLRLALLSGDWIPTDLPGRIRALAPHCRVISLGGATEASIWSILHPVVPQDAARPSIPYGRPMRNQRFHVLDRDLHDCPDWTPGSLYIEGLGLAQGYLDDPGKTAASFITHPVTGARLYKTGDLGRYRDDGCLEFLGREDYQVKIRGHRIEPGEIEAALNSHPEVSASVVVPVGRAGEGLRLVAYVRTDMDHHGLAAALSAHLAARLPAAMLPAAYVGLAALPVTDNGKLDRKALPPPPLTSETVGGPPAAPVTAAERALAGLWEELLGRTGVGTNEDFFAIGGDSLLAARLVLRIRKAFDRDLPLAALFETPTIVGLARRLERQSADQNGPVPLARPAELDRLARLPDDVVPRKPAGPLSPDRETVLLTGATGFLGAALLEALLEADKAPVCCLLRCRDEQDGRERLQRVLGERGLAAMPTLSRLTVVPGNLERPRLGLDEADFAALARRISRVIHCGARVQYAYPYQNLAAANVNGTMEALRLACLGGADVRFLFVSTSAVIAPAGASGRCVTDETPLLHDGTLAGGYPQTKWVAERLCRLAADRGLPVTVIRPGTLWGDSRTGHCNRDDFPSRLAEACREIGCAPDIDARVSILPVDLAARAALTLFARDDAPGATWNLLNPEMADFAAVVAMTNQAVPLAVVPYETWRARLAEACAAAPDNRLTALLPLMPPAKDQLPRPATWDLNRLKAALSQAGITLPVTDAAYVARCLDRLRHDPQPY